SIIAAGIFTHSGADAIAGVARWDGSLWQPMGTSTYQVDHLQVVGPTLYASGSFSGVTHRQVMQWTGTDWQAISAFSADTSALGVFNGQLVAAASNGIHIWTGAAWQDLGGPGNGGYNYQVNALIQYGSQLIAGGAFTSPQYLMAAWNGTSWQQF